MIDIVEDDDEEHFPVLAISGHNESTWLLESKHSIYNLPNSSSRKASITYSSRSITASTRSLTSQKNIKVNAVLVSLASFSSLIVLVVSLVRSLPDPTYLGYENVLEGLKHESIMLNDTTAHYWQPPVPSERCDFITEEIMMKNNGKVMKRLWQQQYAMEDYNVYYRATADIFWLDFACGAWGNFSVSDIGLYNDDDNAETKFLWTWITGDQHLSNFGAWRSRSGEVVFGVNDFDEAAIYDFHIDVVRLAVSIYNHAASNGFPGHAVKAIIHTFLDTYLDTVIDYVGNDEAMVYEVTTKTATGKLFSFLKKVEKKESRHEQLARYTKFEDKADTRVFIRNNQTQLVDVDESMKTEISKAFTSQAYGATMMHMGWHIRGWSDSYFRVIDVAQRVGVGSRSVGSDDDDPPHYYVLLAGGDEGQHEEGSSEIILDVKYEPPAAVRRVLSTDEKAWYDVMFPNEAARAVEAQRQLTSYTDPFTGWVTLDDRSFVVRELSPWKVGFNPDSLLNIKEFAQFTEQVAVITATSHVRGTVSKSPEQFKDMLQSAVVDKLGRKAWIKKVTHLAKNYHKQVLLDFQCFRTLLHGDYQ